MQVHKQNITIYIFSFFFFISLNNKALAGEEKNISVTKSDNFVTYSSNKDKIKKKIVGNGKFKTEVRSLKKIKKIKLLNVGKLIIEEGNESSIKVEGEENILKYIKTEVDGKDLIIKIEIPKHTSITFTKKVILHLKTPNIHNIKELQTKGAIAKININEIINEENDLDIKCSGSSSITFQKDIKVKDLKIKAKGGSKILLSNLDLQKLKVELSNRASLKFNDMKSKDLHIKLEDHNKINFVIGEITDHSKFSLHKNSKVDIEKFISKKVKIKMHGNTRMFINKGNFKEAEVKLSNNSKLEIGDFELKEVKIEMDKNSKFNIEKGNCDEAEIELSDNSKLNASDFSISSIKKLKKEGHSKANFKK